VPAPLAAAAPPPAAATPTTTPDRLRYGTRWPRSLLAQGFGAILPARRTKITDRHAPTFQVEVARSHHDSHAIQDHTVPLQSSEQRTMTSMYSPRRRPTVRHAAVWIISSWIVVTLIGVTIAGVTGGRGPHRGARSGTLAGLSAAQPLLGGQQVSVTAASSVVGFNVPVPKTSIASQGNLTATWAVASRQQVALVFDQGKLDVVMKAAIYQDPTSEYQTFICDTNAKATISQVNGLPALVIPPDTDYSHTNLAWVEFDLSGVNVDIFSASYSTDQLLAVADTMAPPASSSPTPSPSPYSCPSSSPT
jgi:hypothetical protein